MESDGKYKQFENIFRDKQFDLPMQRDENDFFNNVKDVLDKYQERLLNEKLEDTILDKVKIICADLIEIVELYYSGSSAKAYKKFERLMRIIERYLVTIKKTPNNGNSEYLPTLYRTRIVNESIKYKKKDIFHVPFFSRTFVDNARYSLAGFPCLYLSTTLELCHFESNGQNNPLKIFSRFEAKYDGITEIVILDMSKKPKDFLIEFKKGNLNMNKLEEYYYIFPILMTSSFIKPNQKQKFVPEYIIPQFLLQWFKNKYINQNKLCGIRYFSSKDKSNSNRGYNYVFPTIFPSKNNQFCDLLSKNFKLTEPIYTNKENDPMGDLKWLEEELLMSESSYLS